MFRVGDVLKVRKLNGRELDFVGVVVEEKGRGYELYIPENERKGIVENWVKTVFITEEDVEYDVVV